MTTQQGIDWVPLFRKYQGQWVALEEDEVTVVASGLDAKKVYEEARTNGVEIPILLKVPKPSLPLVGQSDV